MRSDSPKLRNKGQGTSKSIRPNSVIVGGSGNKQSISGFKSKVRPNTAHNIVVVKAAAKQESLDKDPDIVRLQVSKSLSIYNPCPPIHTHNIQKK